MGWVYPVMGPPPILYLVSAHPDPAPSLHESCRALFAREPTVTSEAVVTGASSSVYSAMMRPWNVNGVVSPPGSWKLHSAVADRPASMSPYLKRPPPVSSMPEARPGDGQLLQDPWPGWEIVESS